MYEVREGGSHWVRGFTGALVIVIATLGFVVWSPVRSPATEFGFHASLVDQGPSPAVAPGTTTTYSMHFRNTGLVAWQRGTDKQVTLGVGGDATTYADAGMAADWLGPTRIVTTSESFVLPGMVGAFNFKIRAPMTPGTYRVPVRLVVDGLAWLDHEPATVEITSDLGFHSRLIDQTAHVILKPGELSAPLTVRIRNSGAKPWTRGLPGQQANLGITGDDRALSALGVGWPSADRVAIQAEPSVGPGGIATFTFRVRAPVAPGIYALRLRPVVDGLMWLEDDGIVSLITVVSPSGATPTPVPGEAFKNVQPTTFEFGASADPQSLAAGNTVKITATFRSATVGTAFVGVEVYAPGGTTLAYQKWFTNESFAAGQQRSYDVNWLVPLGAAVGTYTVDVSAYSPGWKTLYGSQSTAVIFAVAPAASLTTPAPQSTAAPAAPPPATPAPATTSTPAPASTSTPAPASTSTAVPTSTAAPTASPAPTVVPPAPTATAAPPPQPSFGTAASVSPATVLRGDSMAVSVAATSTMATTALVDIELWSPGAASATYQVWFDNQSFVAGQQRTYPATWQVPAAAPLGTYTVKVGVYAPSWALLYSLNASATTFLVAAPAATPAPTATPAPSTLPSPTATPGPTTPPVPTPTPSAVPPSPFTTISSVPGSVAPGTSLPINVSVTSVSAATVLVDIEVIRLSPRVQVNQQWFDNQTFAAGQLRSFPVSWVVPTNALPGTYIVNVGVFSVGWASLLSWTEPAATFTVTAPAATPSPVPTTTPAPTSTPAPTTTPIPTATPSPIAGAPSPLHVQGNRLVNASGVTVTLHGVNRMGTEYACIQGWGLSDGPQDAASISIMKSWKINAVRIPMNEDCWLGINGALSQYSGANYQQMIRNYVNVINQAGLYVFLDLHWTAPGSQKATGQMSMPNMDHTPTFWSQVAAQYKNNGAVILELFNEPYPDSNQDSAAAWRCWRDGGTCPGLSFQVAGMQTLLNSVRSAGATNVVALAGVQWASQLSQFLAYKPVDPLNNIAAVWHAYDFQGCAYCFDARAGAAAAAVPVLSTEIGADQCNPGFLTSVLSWLDSKAQSYLAWTWNTGSGCGSNMLVMDWYSGTPTTYGQTIRDHFIANPP